MLMPHVGLDISDDAIHCIGYEGVGHNRRLSIYGRVDLPKGLFDGGDIRDEKAFVAILTEFTKKYGLSKVKVSIPEEKAYLFQTDVPSTDQSTIEQNIEFKLEENVPLSAGDAVFYFDLLPRNVTGGAIRASVSVVPRTYVEHYMSMIEKAGLQPVSFETVPKAIARSVIPFDSDSTRLIIHVTAKKTGLYVVCGNVVNFAVTAGWGSDVQTDADREIAIAGIRKEISRVKLYWLSHGNGKDIEEAVLVGKNSALFEPVCHSLDGDEPLSARVADVWCNAMNVEKRIPPISKVDSLEYAAAAGLAFDTSTRNS